MSRDSLLQTIRSAVASLRTALQELEEEPDHWELVEPVSHVAPEPARGSSAGTGASSSSHPVSGPGFSPPSSPASALRDGSLAPRLGDPLPGDALFLVSSLHTCDRQPRAVRAWEAGLQAGAVLRGEFEVPNATPSLGIRNRFYVVLWCRGIAEVRVFTSFGRFKQYTGPLEHSRTICHGFPTEGESRVFVRAAGLLFPEREQWS